jgi:hypothetical protein
VKDCKAEKENNLKVAVDFLFIICTNMEGNRANLKILPLFYFGPFSIKQLIRGFHINTPILYDIFIILYEIFLACLSLERECERETGRNVLSCSVKEGQQHETVEAYLV